MSLQGKNAMLFGAGAIASGYAELMARLGARLALVSRGESAARLAEELKNKGFDEPLSLRADVSDPSGVRDAFARVRGELSMIDIVVNGAGGATPDATASTLEQLLAMPPDAMKRMMEVNFLSKWYSLQAYLEYLADASHRGSVVNITSMGGLTPLSRAVGYSAAFAAVENLTKSMAYVYSHYGYGRVNNVAVGFVCGDQNRRLLFDENGQLTPRGGEIMAGTSQHRFLDPSDIAPHVVHLADEEISGAVNGDTFRVDGGYGLILLAQTGWQQ